MKQKEKISNNESGATMVEYAFLVAIMSIGMIVSVSAMQVAVHDKFDRAAEELGAGGIQPPDLP